MAKPRSVAVCILIHTSDLSSSPHFLIVTSRRHENRWILPKGGVELNESSIEAAEREAWEEGGLVLHSAMHLCHVITLQDLKPHPLSPSHDTANANFIPSSIYTFELFHCPSKTESLADEWPEKSERQRKWVEGWDALLEITTWGKRETIMRTAIIEARKRCEAM